MCWGWSRGWSARPRCTHMAWFQPYLQAQVTSAGSLQAHPGCLHVRLRQERFLLASRGPTWLTEAHDGSWRSCMKPSVAVDITPMAQELPSLSQRLPWLPAPKQEPTGEGENIPLFPALQTTHPQPTWSNGSLSLTSLDFRTSLALVQARSHVFVKPSISIISVTPSHMRNKDAKQQVLS